jgi:hypothetical protein
MNRSTSVGFSQRVQLDWLEQTAQLSLSGYPRDEIQKILDAMLSNKLSVGNDKKSGSRQLTISILLRIWVSTPKELETFRDEGLQHLWRLPLVDHLSIHWGMIVSVYPFFGVVAEMVGRLSSLQGYVAAAQLQRRIRERYGERETVTRSTRRILRCFVDWGVLQDTSEKGIYRTITPVAISDKQSIAWLMESVLYSGGAASGSLQSIVKAPMLFPFLLTVPNAVDVSKYSYLELSRQGLNQETILLQR